MLFRNQDHCLISNPTRLIVFLWVAAFAIALYYRWGKKSACRYDASR